MTGYTNVGGRQVLVCDIHEWLDNRGLVAVPRFANDAMLDAGNANIKYQIEEDPERSGTPAWPYASTVWNAMVQAAASPAPAPKEE